MADELHEHDEHTPGPVDLADIENRVIVAKNDEIDLLRAEVAALRARQGEHLALIARLSQTVPLESEVADALAQRGALVAEIGTLRSMVAGLEGENAGLRVTAAFFETKSDDLQAVVKRELGATEKRRNQGHCVLCGLTAMEVVDDIEAAFKREHEGTVRVLTSALRDALDWATPTDHRHDRGFGGYESRLMPMYFRIGRRMREDELARLTTLLPAEGS